MAKEIAPPNRSDTAAPTEYTVVARRYRPQQFTELVGQEPVARALMNAITSDRVAHAYLFTGARGTGKTSTARILAKALNCEKGPTPTPCDACEICRAIVSGEDIDVLEIDGASNRGIDDVRAIRQNVNTRPTRSRYKIYIIDEVHMLSKDAFNALLKTLEEPPPHVKFIFATTEVQKIPITILSRCQRFDFAGISSPKIAERLKQVVAAEGMQADDDALMIIARRGGGSMRDAQSLLDQLLSFGGERLTTEKLHQLLGTATDERILALVDTIVAKEAKAAFELLGSYAEEGLQLGELLDQLIDYWRNLMVLNCGGKEFADVSLAEKHREKAYQHASSLSLDSILSGLDILTTTKSRLRGSNHGLVLLEMATLRLIRLDELVPVAQLAQWLSQPGTTPTPTASKPAPARSLPAADHAKKNSIANPVGGAVAPNGAAPNRDAKIAPAPPPTDIATITANVCLEVGLTLGENLKSAGLPAITGPKSLVFNFGSRYTHQHDYCSEPDSIKRIQLAFKEITGLEWNIRIEHDATEERLPQKATTEVQPVKAVTYRERELEVAKIPLIGRAIDKMGARLLKMDVGFGSSEPVPVESDLPEPQES